MLHVEWYHVCWPWLTAKRVEPVVSISWASCCPHVKMRFVTSAYATSLPVLNKQPGYIRLACFPAIMLTSSKPRSKLYKCQWNRSLFYHGCRTVVQVLLCLCATSKKRVAVDANSLPVGRQLGQVTGSTPLTTGLVATTSNGECTGSSKKLPKDGWPLQ